MTPRISGSMALIALSVLGSQAMAQTPSPHYAYGGISAGQSQFKLNEDQDATRLLGDGTTINAIDDDDKDTAWKAFLGYQFNRYLALEGGYFDLGKAKYSADTSAGLLNGELKVRGWNLDLVGTIPFTDRFAMLARIGAQRAKTSGVYDGAVASDTSRTQNNYKYGLGLQYAITPSVLIRGEWERYRIPAVIDGRHNVNVASLSLVFPFGRTTTPAPRQVVENTYIVPVPAPAPEPAPAPAPAPQPPQPERVSFSAESLFGFDQDKIGANGRAALDKFSTDLQGMNVERIQITGHTDRLGTDAYNQKLSERRAHAVRGYLVNVKGLDAGKVTATGAGESQPVTKAGDCPTGDKRTAALVACLQPDRRVDIDVTGTR